MSTDTSSKRSRETGSGHVGNLSPGQEDALVAFRNKAEAAGLLTDNESFGDDDELLLRFLRARQFKVDKAFAMYKTTVEWRRGVEGVGLDKLYREMDPFRFEGREVMFKYWPMYMHKTDKEGHPINIQHFGDLDLTQLYKHVDKETHWKSVVVNAESGLRECIPASSRRYNIPNGENGLLSIVDLEGFSIGQFWSMKSVAQRCFSLTQDNYPETLVRLEIINAPSFLASVWNIVKRWLAKETVNKMHISGRDYHERIFSLVDKANLPTSLGGECTCEGLGGCLLSSAGPWMDEREEKARKESEKEEAEKRESAGNGNVAEKAQGSSEVTLADEGQEDGKHTQIDVGTVKTIEAVKTKGEDEMAASRHIPSIS